MEWALQTALFARLSADPDLIALGASVSDDLPQGDDDDPSTGFPHVTIGEMDVRDIGTKATDLFDVILRLHTFSAKSSRKEARAIQARLFELLHKAEFPVPGFNLVSIRRETSDLDRDPDRKRHGVCEFRVIIEPL